MERPKDPHVPCKPLTLVAQLPEFAQIGAAQRRPATEESRHTLVAGVPRFAKLGGVEHCKVPRKALDHLGHIPQSPQAPAPYGTLEGLLPTRPNHFRILAAKLRAICIGTSLPPPSAQWPVRSTRKERLGKRHPSRSPDRQLVCPLPRGSRRPTLRPWSRWSELQSRSSEG